MKKKLLIGLLFVAQITFSQNFQTVEEVNNACATLGFASDEDAEIAVDNILDQIGVPRNFTLQECPNINNAIAKNIENSAGLKERYILYDADFFTHMDSKAGNNWAAISILAHEIGHHLSGHALNNQGSNHKFELQADYFSGNALARLGATLKEAQSAINTLKYEKATSTHPAKADRLNSIEKGWNKAKGITQTVTVEEEKEEKAIEHFRKGEIAFQNFKYQEALVYFNKAKDLEYADAYYYLSSIYRNGFGVLVDAEEAYRLSKIGYELGSIPATFQMGTLLFRGTGVKENEEEAERLFKKNYQIKWFKDQYKKYKQPIYAFAIGTMYYNGYGGVNEDKEIAVIWFRQAADQGEPKSQVYLGYMYEVGEYFEIDSDEAKKWYVKAAKNKYCIAEQNLGVHYKNGIGTSINYKKSMQWYLRAAEQNSAGAQIAIGDMYKGGLGVEKDYDKALQWYKKAVSQDSSTAFFKIGWMYRFGVKKNYLEALKWFKKSAEYDDKDAQYWIGRMYMNGLGVEKDYKEALSWFKKAAGQDHVYSKKLIGDFYFKGYGVERNYKKCVYWYRKAAEQGNASAQSSLGDKYEYGDGVEIDYDEAIKWYKKSAEQGNSNGQYNLGKMFLRGNGVEQNNEKAIFWYKKAAKQDHQQAQKKLRQFGETW